MKRVLCLLLALGLLSAAPIMAEGARLTLDAAAPPVPGAVYVLQGATQAWDAQTLADALFHSPQSPRTYRRYDDSEAVENDALEHVAVFDGRVCYADQDRLRGYDWLLKPSLSSAYLPEDTDYQRETPNLPLEQAAAMADAMIQIIVPDCVAGVSAYRAYDAAALRAIADELTAHDDEYVAFLERGKIGQHIADGDEVYVIEFALSLEGVPLYGAVEPALPVASRDSPRPAEQAAARAVVGRDGVIELTLDGAFMVTGREKADALLTADQAADRLGAIFAGETPSYDRVITGITFEYVPLRQGAGAVTVVPVWCFLEAKYDKAYRINALTGALLT